MAVLGSDAWETSNVTSGLIAAVVVAPVDLSGLSYPAILLCRTQGGNWVLSE